jgi:hypothetical protein
MIFLLIVREDSRTKSSAMLSGKKAPILHNKDKDKPAVLRDGSILTN